MMLLGTTGSAHTAAAVRSFVQRKEHLLPVNAGRHVGTHNQEIIPTGAMVQEVRIVQALADTEASMWSQCTQAAGLIVCGYPAGNLSKCPVRATGDRAETWHDTS